jgi:hypothetical protein
MNCILATHGIPKVIHSDNGPCEEMKTYMHV